MMSRQWLWKIRREMNWKWSHDHKSVISNKDRTVGVPHNNTDQFLLVTLLWARIDMHSCSLCLFFLAWFVIWWMWWRNVSFFTRALVIWFLVSWVMTRVLTVFLLFNKWEKELVRWREWRKKKRDQAERENHDLRKVSQRCWNCRWLKDERRALGVKEDGQDV